MRRWLSLRNGITISLLLGAVAPTGSALANEIGTDSVHTHFLDPDDTHCFPAPRLPCPPGPMHGSDPEQRDQTTTNPGTQHPSADHDGQSHLLILDPGIPNSAGAIWPLVPDRPMPNASGFSFSSRVLLPSPLEEVPGDSVAQIEHLHLDAEVIENSPVLQEWLREIPDISDEIRNDPSFRTRLRVGYAQFPSSNQASGIHLGVEDVFLMAGTGLTASGSFNRSWNDSRESFGAEVRYYLLPLGSYVNLTPTLGYRSLETPDYITNGLDVGFRFMIIPSRGGGADITFSQHWVAPGRDDEVSMTTISVGYAVTSRLRLGTDLEFQTSRAGQESRLGVLLEWLM